MPASIYFLRRISLYKILMLSKTPKARACHHGQLALLTMIHSLIAFLLSEIKFLSASDLFKSRSMLLNFRLVSSQTNLSTNINCFNHPPTSFHILTKSHKARNLPRNKRHKNQHNQHGASNHQKRKLPIRSAHPPKHNLANRTNPPNQRTPPPPT